MKRPSDTFKTRLREVREHKGISQREIVVRLKEHGIEMHQPSYSQIESGKRQVSLDEAVALARIFRVPLERLYMSWEDLLVFESEMGLPTPSPKEGKQ